MPQKSFKDNPAFQFISSAQPDSGAPEHSQMQAPEPQPESARPTPPEGYKLNPLYVEIKTRRLQLVLQPSLYERVKAGAKARGLSVNEYVHQILDTATKAD